jgi:hypothetical protein
MSLKLVSKLALAAFAALSFTVVAHAGTGNIAQQSGKGDVTPPAKQFQQFGKGKNSQAPVQSQDGKGGKNDMTPPFKGKQSNKNGSKIFSSGNNGGNSSGTNGGNTPVVNNRNRNQ